ncbi:unnamed protein product [Cylicocyclus nassatus]|uniref:D-alanyl-D-alanine carboxypeptidase-like core domain-containing protein n=1 Tax=Cylicocyclus nassatus TaxID=53992 RepID=A0AA36GQK8_CYLNA|nr:unnamed protein product [Cylicocyclus nassatus]
MNARLMNDKKYLQRVLRLAGYPVGAIDGIVGERTKGAIRRWDEDCANAIVTWGELDKRSEDNLSTLVPFAQLAIRKWFSQKVKAFMAKHNVEVKVICGTRTIAEQDALYAQGRTKPGAKVTNARGGSSMHNYAIAIDLESLSMGNMKRGTNGISSSTPNVATPMVLSGAANGNPLWTLRIIRLPNYMKEYQVFKGSFYVATNKSDADITITDTRTGVTLCTVATGSQALFVAIGSFGGGGGNTKPLEEEIERLNGSFLNKTYKLTS